MRSCPNIGAAIHSRPPDLQTGVAHTHGDKRRAWSESFLRYAYAIVQDPAYRDMPCTTDADGKLDWIIPSNRRPGSKNWDGNDRRRKWWAERARAIGVPTEGKWISRVAKTIHPWGWKPCQPCGRWMRISYSYPTSRTVNKLNEHLPPDERLEFEDFLDIYEVIDHLSQVLGLEGAIRTLRDVFPALGAIGVIDSSALQELARERLVAVESRKLSPGAMCNPPDRLDGFHTYNLCCRAKQDTGRSAKNLRSYGVDRRAFEHWSEGDWEAANVLMTEVGIGRCPGSECTFAGQLTADHIGPISLGFRHNPHFVAACGPCNSAKNNRMRMVDVERLIALEAEGIDVTSWQASAVWELLQHRVRDDEGALRLSKLMNVNQHQFLRLLLRACRQAPDALLQFLSPGLAAERVDFVGLDPATLSYERIERTPRQATFAQSKAARLVRVAFEALDEYGTKQKRNVQPVPVDLLAAADAEVERAIARAARDPSPWRTPLGAALDPSKPPGRREGLLKALFASDKYEPDHDFRYLRVAFADYMRATGEVLADRFNDARAIKEWADPLEADDHVFRLDGLQTPASLT
jgi:Alw26I/Eco31I/Esp3I family type II restriction endonuclease